MVILGLLVGALIAYLLGVVFPLARLEWWFGAPGSDPSPATTDSERPVPQVRTTGWLRALVVLLPILGAFTSCYWVVLVLAVSVTGAPNPDDDDGIFLIGSVPLFLSIAVCGLA